MCSTVEHFNFYYITYFISFVIINWFEENKYTNKIIIIIIQLIKTYFNNKDYFDVKDQQKEFTLV